MDALQQAIEVRGRESKRRFRAVEEKRRIVEETLQPGASVVRVARAHGVNANQVFGWRRLYRQGRLERKESETPSLLPVRVTNGAVPGARCKSTATRRTPSGPPAGRAGVIQLELPKGQLRIAGRVDAETLRVVLEQLLG